MVKLTSQQNNVLTLVCKGKCYKEIAVDLNISYSRVNSIITVLRNKAKLTDGSRFISLYNWALANKLVKAPPGTEVEE